ncbi:Putative F-box/FBD/LRR-repeat protein At5g22610 [Linum grandiflorum]
MATQEEGNSSSSVDILSDFPNDILTHILSFAEIKDVVRTSVLSQRWKFIWKYVRVINIDYASFPNYASFVRCVEKFILQSDQPKIDRINLVDNLTIEGSSAQLHRRVFQYAASHDIRHLEMRSYIRDRITDSSGRIQDTIPQAARFTYANMSVSVAFTPLARDHAN